MSLKKTRNFSKHWKWLSMGSGNTGDFYFLLHDFPYYKTFLLCKCHHNPHGKHTFLNSTQICRAETKREWGVHVALTSRVYCLHLIDFHFPLSPCPWLPGCTWLHCPLNLQWWGGSLKEHDVSLWLSPPFKALGVSLCAWALWHNSFGSLKTLAQTPS